MKVADPETVLEKASYSHVIKLGNLCDLRMLPTSETTPTTTRSNVQ